MEYLQEYQRWRQHPGLDQELKRELDMIEGADEEILDRFGRELAFGTGGIRGPMGAGKSRMNIYLIRKATAGLAAYLKDTFSDEKITVAIAYDTRKNSNRFARETVAVLAYEGIEAWLFPDPAPTPLLSFAVRQLGAKAGIVITASHNPPADNGYKVYGDDGCQITDVYAHAIMDQIARVTDELSVPVLDLVEAEAKGLLRWIPISIETDYMDRVRKLSLIDGWWEEGMDYVKAVYTPLHGTGARHLPQVFASTPAIEGIPVPEQMIMDASCPTVKYPNPEDWEVYEMANRLGTAVGADLLMATDLDADRLGVASRNRQGEFVPITGNQLGCLMLDYILSQRKATGTLPLDGLMVQTVVTSDLGKVIASSYGVEIVETLTGFKYIGETIKQRVDIGLNTFLFGYEESYGYLIGDFVRDKDAMQAALFASEVAVFHKNRGKDLHEALDDIYQRFGFFYEDLININLLAGQSDPVVEAMDNLRNKTPKTIGGSPVIKMYDYLLQRERNLSTGREESISLPKSNSIKLVSEDGSWFCVRPSGTEPKMKVYFGVKDQDRDSALEKKDLVGNEIRAILDI